MVLGEGLASTDIRSRIQRRQMERPGLLVKLTVAGLVVASAVLGFALSQAVASGPRPQADTETIPTTDPAPTPTTEPSTTTETDPVPDDPVPTPDPAPVKSVGPEPAPVLTQPVRRARSVDRQAGATKPPSSSRLPVPTTPDTRTRTTAPQQEARPRPRQAKPSPRPTLRTHPAPKSVRTASKSPERVTTVGRSVTIAGPTALGWQASAAWAVLFAAIATVIGLIYVVVERR
jgi:hypothetical protein